MISYDEACKRWAADRLHTTPDVVEKVDFEQEHRYWSAETGCDWDLVAHVTLVDNLIDLDGLDFGELVRDLFAIASDTAPAVRRLLVDLPCGHRYDILPHGPDVTCPACTSQFYVNAQTFNGLLEEERSDGGIT